MKDFNINNFVIIIKTIDFKSMDSMIKHFIDLLKNVIMNFIQYYLLINNQLISIGFDITNFYYITFNIIDFK